MGEQLGLQCPDDGSSSSGGGRPGAAGRARCPDGLRWRLGRGHARRREHGPPWAALAPAQALAQPRRSGHAGHGPGLGGVRGRGPPAARGLGPGDAVAAVLAPARARWPCSRAAPPGARSRGLKRSRCVWARRPGPVGPCAAARPRRTGARGHDHSQLRLAGHRRLGRAAPTARGRASASAPARHLGRARARPGGRPWHNAGALPGAAQAPCPRRRGGPWPRRCGCGPRSTARARQPPVPLQRVRGGPDHGGAGVRPSPSRTFLAVQGPGTAAGRGADRARL